MANFISFEDDVDNSSDNNIEADVSENVSVNDFIDDSDIFESIETYYSFMNASRSYDEAMQDALIDLDNSQEANNYCPDDYDLGVDIIDEFKESTKNVNDFKNIIVIPTRPENKDSFYYPLLHAIRYQLKK